eukprot:scaffold2322_cov135-Cylindrotheca_fusiformis.AAC.2
MLVTGLLSLNIHDSLTFDGSELCLHPDLFSALAAAEGGLAPGSQHTSTGSGTSTTVAGSVGLAVGDMIEIRVWDSLPRESTNKSPPGPLRTNSLGSIGSNLRHNPSASTSSTPINQSNKTIIPGSSSIGPPNLPSLPVMAEWGDALQVEVPSNIQTTNLRPRAPSMAHSLQYSVDSDAESEHNDVQSSDKPSTIEEETKSISTKEETDGATSSSNRSLDGTHKSPNSPSKAVALSAGAPAAAPAAASGQGGSLLPPVFPRARLNSSDPLPPSAVATNGKPKPITMARRGKSNATATGSISAPHHRSPKTLSRHSRELSDMTIDSHQLDNYDLFQSAVSMENTSMDDDVSKSSLSATHNLRLSFVLLVTDKTLTTLKGNTRTQISMLRQVADLYSLSSYDTVTVHKIEQEDEEEVLKAVSADFVVVTIKDQYISRGDMVYFQNSLKGSWIYEGQRLTEDAKGIKAHAREIRHGNFSAKSGIVTEDTMVTVRSRSARIIWLVQLSCEMWDYSSPYGDSYQNQSICEIYFDQWIRFVSKLFTKWKELEVTHSLTVIFFSRTFLTNGQKSCFDLRDVYGRSYEDHYKPVVENETGLDWHHLVVRIKEEFIKYPLEVGWSFDRRPSSASQGNILEAINVTLNVMQYHYLDRDLHRTGQSIVVISPGGGVFEVNKGLSEITYQRMMDNGIGSDMLSLGLPPLHIAPFFLYNNDYQTVETRGVDTSETYYEVPHWMHLSFISYDREDDGQDRHEKPKEPSSEDRKKIRNWLDSYEVTSNGFLRPRIDPDALGTDDSPGMKMSSFSAVGNAAATPRKTKAAQERQLISGRDFRDILEACKPRITGMALSSSLASILEIEKESFRQLIGTTETRRPSSGKIMPLREWGTIDFSELMLPPKSKPNRPDSPLSRRPHPFESIQEKGDDADSGSNSSFASYVSSVLGYDRVLWDQFSSSPSMMSKPTVQLQRSLSIEFEKILKPLKRLDSDAAMTGDSVSLGSSNISRGSLGKASTGGESESYGENEGTESSISGQDKRIEKLRKMMDIHDARVCTRFGSENDEIREIHIMPVQPSDSEATISSKGTPKMQRSGKEKSPPGGLGAALSQYDGSSKQLESPRDMRPTRTRSASARATQSSFKIERSRAASPLMPSIRSQTLEKSTRTTSPILPPQVPSMQPNGTFSTDISEPEQATSKDDRFLSSREFVSSSTMPLMDAHDTGGISGQPLGASLPRLDQTRQRRMARSPPLGAGILSSSRASKKTLATSPSRSNTRERSDQRHGRKTSSHNRQPVQSRIKKVFNPFRQSDEDAVLAKRSHNRRRWSHVFPVGEVEFKRHAGPIWNSLTSPAILPLSVDYFPSPHELRDESRFQFSPYTVTLSGIDKSHYSTHDELLMEMVRQRVTQDFQIVTAAAVEQSKSRPESQRQARNSKPQLRGKGRSSVPSSLPAIKPENSGVSKRYLSMGHRIQVFECDPSSDTIEIVHYNEISATNDALNVFKYKFLLYSNTTKEYTQSTQTFKKYAEPYRWNKVDNIICGEEERRMWDGMRFRRLMFGLIPESFQDREAEEAYVSKFSRLVEYLGKLREKEDENQTLDIKIVRRADGNNIETQDANAKRVSSDAMVRFAVQLRRRKRDPFEWLEIAIDSTFDTRRSYRITFNWLVASTSKIDAQIQLLHRRCTQFGLRLICFPQTTISPNLYLHAFAVPSLFCIRDSKKAARVDAVLKSKGFVDDGVRLTDGSVLECIDRSEEYDFPRRRGKIKSIPGKQYVHRSGALFMRNIMDQQGWTILAGIENYRHASKENEFRKIASRLVREVAGLLAQNTPEQDVTSD